MIDINILQWGEYNVKPLNVPMKRTEKHLFSYRGYVPKERFQKS